MSFISKNAFLSSSEQQTNALYIYNYLIKRGWTLNAIAGMLGNMQTESTINPGIWQNLDEGNTSLGYGLVQWTPSTKYTSWCKTRGLEPSHMVSALKRIEWEVANGQQYYKTDAYPLTFSQFKKSTESPSYLAQAFLKNYERPADQTQPARSTQAEQWYTYLSEHGGSGSGDSGDTGGGSTDTGGTITIPKKRKLSLLLLLAATRRRK